MSHDRIQRPSEEEALDITGRYDAALLAAEKAVLSFVRCLKKVELNPSCNHFVTEVFM